MTYELIFALMNAYHVLSNTIKIRENLNRLLFYKNRLSLSLFAALVIVYGYVTLINTYIIINSLVKKKTTLHLSMSTLLIAPVTQNNVYDIIFSISTYNSIMATKIMIRN